MLGNKKNEVQFLDEEGMYVLMEFLESCNPMHRKMTLSSLSRLVENPKTITYFCDWNSSKSMINSTRLLVKIYNEEDKRHSVNYQSGILENKGRPLNPKSAHGCKKL